jgi:hypothetical protein
MRSLLPQDQFAERLKVERFDTGSAAQALRPPRQRAPGAVPGRSGPEQPFWPTRLNGCGLETADSRTNVRWARGKSGRKAALVGDSPKRPQPKTSRSCKGVKPAPRVSLVRCRPARRAKQADAAAITADELAVLDEDQAVRP